MKRTRGYIGGPMSGIPSYNLDAFVAAKEAWVARGHNIVIPFDLNAVVWGRHHNTPWNPGVDKAEWGDPIAHEMFALDLQTIHDVDFVALLPGWEKSKGVATELVVALTYGRPIYDAATFQLLDITPQISFKVAA
jgi:hypothetical protein